MPCQHFPFPRETGEGTGGSQAHLHSPGEHKALVPKLPSRVSNSKESLEDVGRVNLLLQLNQGSGSSVEFAPSSLWSCRTARTLKSPNPAILQSAAMVFPLSSPSRLDVALLRLFTSWNNFQMPTFA